MERITRWWRSRQQARVSTDSNISRPVMRIVVIVLAVVFLVALVWSILLGGRWVYRKVTNINDSSQQQSNDETQSQGDGQPVENNGDQPSEGEQSGDGAEAPGTPALPTPTPSTPPPSTTVPAVPRTGPSEE